MLQEYIKKDLIFIDQISEHREELFDKMADIFLQKGYVTQGFKDFLQDRETSYPTGLELKGYAVAIPHGNPELIVKPFISVVRLDQPVTMYRMDDPEELIPVRLFFFLGLDDGGNHLRILREIMQHIQNEEMMLQLLTAVTEEEFLQTLKTL